MKALRSSSAANSSFSSLVNFSSLVFMRESWGGEVGQWLSHVNKANNYLRVQHKMARSNHIPVRLTTALEDATRPRQTRRASGWLPVKVVIRQGQQDAKYGRTIHYNYAFANKTLNTVNGVKPEAVEVATKLATRFVNDENKGESRKRLSVRNEKVRSSSLLGSTICFQRLFVLLQVKSSLSGYIRLRVAPHFMSAYCPLAT